MLMPLKTHATAALRKSPSMLVPLSVGHSTLFIPVQLTEKPELLQVRRMLYALHKII